MGSPGKTERASTPLKEFKTKRSSSLNEEEPMVGIHTTIKVSWNWFPTFQLRSSHLHFLTVTPCPVELDGFEKSILSLFLPSSSPFDSVQHPHFFNSLYPPLSITLKGRTFLSLSLSRSLSKFSSFCPSSFFLPCPSFCFAAYSFPF